jgi:hypothetical protein
MKIWLCRKRSVYAAVFMGIGLCAGGCLKTPSEKYGLAPPDAGQAYPQIMQPVPHKRATLTPSEQTQAVARLERDANRQETLSASQLRVRGVNGR